MTTITRFPIERRVAAIQAQRDADDAAVTRALLKAVRSLDHEAESPDREKRTLMLVAQGAAHMARLLIEQRERAGEPPDDAA